MLSVFHNDKFIDYMLHNGKLAPVTTMRLVAVVDTSDPEEAFKLTNNVDNPWPQNETVTPESTSESYRSTSVGDLVVDGMAGARGSKHLIVEPCGFRELTIEEVSTLCFCLPTVVTKER